jgi:hypothetical protein
MAKRSDLESEVGMDCRGRFSMSGASSISTSGRILSATFGKDLPCRSTRSLKTGQVTVGLLPRYWTRDDDGFLDPNGSYWQASTTILRIERIHPGP